MSDSVADSTGKSRTFRMPDLPLVVWMVLASLCLGLVSGMGSQELVSAYNEGFGWALGEFALILLPSFTLAAVLSRQNVMSVGAGRTTAVVSPVAGAGMICPDTAYAALSPAAGGNKLDLAFGAYAGFKLLYPAGPLIVAAGLGVSGVEPAFLLMCGVLLCIPVAVVGMLWGRFTNPMEVSGAKQTSSGQAGQIAFIFAPFLLMAGLLVLGGAIGTSGNGAIDFFLMPKGALLLAAILALLQLDGSKHRECLDSAVRRTGSLLLVIGAASAFGTILTGMLPIAQWVPQGSGSITLIALFALTVLFKLAQGSSMATFAAVAPVAAPIVLSSGANPVAAVFAICLGSFIAILPNDSYYWLVRQDALKHIENDLKAVHVLTGGAILQALVGLGLLLTTVYFVT